MRTRVQMGTGRMDANAMGKSRCKWVIRLKCLKEGKLVQRVQVAQEQKWALSANITNQTGADPGFLAGGGVNPPGGGANIQICQIFPKKTA